MEDNRDIVIWGASGHSLVVADILRLQGTYRVIGHLDDINVRSHGELFAGSFVLGGREQLSSLRRDGVADLCVAIGDCDARLELADVAKEYGFNLPVVIHPSSVTAKSAQVGRGTVLCAGSIVGPLANIGESVIVNTGVSVDHQCVIENGVHLAPGVRLAGHVKIGEGSLVGIGSVVKDQASIGRHCLIGAGSVVVHNISDRAIAYGVPARVRGTT
ncbi:acetyltransferase [Gammaproteobacteria bacterium]|nr:acetyltransferase [Gammaproteobacteria bacterium]